MTQLYGYLVDTVIPRILEGLVVVVVLPIILTSYRYASRPSPLPLNNPTHASVSQLDREATTFTFEVKRRSSVILPFQKIGLLASLESGYLGTRINPILTRGALVLRQENSDLDELSELSDNILLPELADNLLLAELVSRIEQMGSPLDLSNSIESLEHSSDDENSINTEDSFTNYANPYPGAAPGTNMACWKWYDNTYYGANTDQVESSLDLSNSIESLEHSSDDENSMNTAPEASFTSYANPYPGAAPGTNMGCWKWYDNPCYGSDEEDENETPPV